VIDDGDPLQIGGRRMRHEIAPAGIDVVGQQAIRRAVEDVDAFRCGVNDPVLHAHHGPRPERARFRLRGGAHFEVQRRLPDHEIRLGGIAEDTSVSPLGTMAAMSSPFEGDVDEEQRRPRLPRKICVNRSRFLTAASRAHQRFFQTRRSPARRHV
jgi:hypothetical protein